jgi:hypothetical protein
MSRKTISAPDFGCNLESLRRGFAKPGTQKTEPLDAEGIEKRDARQSAWRLAGNRGAAALFAFWEVADCPACDPRVIEVRVSLQTWKDGAGNLVASTPGQMEVLRCELCDGKLRVVAFDDQSGTFGALALRPADLADERRWQFLSSKKDPGPLGTDS